MKIRYLSGPKQNQSEHVENSVGRFAVSAGLAEEIVTGEVTAPGPGGRDETYRLPKPGDVAPPVDRWAVSVMQFGTKSHLVITLESGSFKAFYFGEPGHVNDKRVWQGGYRYLNGFGRACPEAIVAEYKKQFKRNPELRFVPDFQAASLGVNSASNEKAAQELKNHEEQDKQRLEGLQEALRQ